MSFKDFIQEKLIQGGGGEPIHENPDWNTIEAIYNKSEYNTVRGLKANGNWYAWDGGRWLHFNIIRALGLINWDYTWDGRIEDGKMIMTACGYKNAMRKQDIPQLLERDPRFARMFKGHQVEWW